MSNPDKAVAQDDFPEGKDDKSTPAEKTSFDAAAYEKEIVTACNDMEFDDNGKWKVPEGMAPEKQFAVNSERRRRDTQTSEKKAKQTASAATAKAEALTERLEKSVKPNLTVEQAEELEDLKESDAEAWRNKLNEYEDAAIAAHEEDMETIDTSSTQSSERVRREQLLEDFTSANPDLALTDEVFANDLPQRITGKLEQGGSFEEFLDEAKEFLSKGKAIDTKTDEAEPNLGKAGGTGQPSDSGEAAAEEIAYKNQLL